MKVFILLVTIFTSIHLFAETRVKAMIEANQDLVIEFSDQGSTTKVRDFLNKIKSTENLKTVTGPGLLLRCEAPICILRIKPDYYTNIYGNFGYGAEEEQGQQLIRQFEMEQTVERYSFAEDVLWFEMNSSLDYFLVLISEENVK